MALRTDKSWVAWRNENPKNFKKQNKKREKKAC